MWPCALTDWLAGWLGGPYTLTNSLIIQDLRSEVRPPPIEFEIRRGYMVATHLQILGYFTFPCTSCLQGPCAPPSKLC